MKLCELGVHEEYILNGGNVFPTQYFKYKYK